MDVHGSLVFSGDVLTVFFIDDRLKKRRVSGICVSVSGRSDVKILKVLVHDEGYTQVFIRSPMIVAMWKLRSLDRIELKF